jgi:septum formation protein
MRQIVPDFEVMEPNIDERRLRDACPQALTMKLTQAKLAAIIPRVTGLAVVVTSDQVIVWNGSIREKPLDAREAREFLRGYRKYPAKCVTAVLAYNTITQRDVIVIDCAKVYFKDLTDEAIERIIAEKVIFTCAGGFAAGHPSFDPYIARIVGTRDSVMGLPLNLTRLVIKDAAGELP